MLPLRPIFPNAIRLHLLLTWTLCLLGCAVLKAEPFQPSQLTAGMERLQDLHGNWQDEEGLLVATPFVDFEARELDLRRRIEVTSLEAPLFLYFEGLAWTAEVYVNGILLDISTDPFGEHLYPLDKSMLQVGPNEIRVRMQRAGPDLPLYPEHFVGIFRQAALLGIAREPRPWKPLAQATATGRAVVVAPWTASGSPIGDLAVVQRALDGLFAYPGNDPVYFAFRPSSETEAFLAELNIPVLDRLPTTDSVAFYNPYPIQEQPLRQNVAFWRLTDGRPGPDYGTYHTLDTLRTPAVTNPDQLALLILLLVPVLTLLFMKVGTPKIYASMFEFLTKTKIYLELIANNKFLKTQQRWLLNLLRQVLTAVAVSLMVYYLQQTGRKDMFDLLTRDSYLGRLLSEEVYTLYQIFAGFSVVLVSANLLKYVLLNISGGIYRVNWLSVLAQNLDVFSSLPMILLPLIPAPFIFFLEPSLGQIVLHIWFALLLIYFLRRIVLIYIGLTRLFSFSPALKILYICTLEILPWIILL